MDWPLLLEGQCPVHVLTTCSSVEADGVCKRRGANALLDVKRPRCIGFDNPNMGDVDVKDWR